ncbi:DUF5671 domain-containing protein [Patescibacteria group bacterium]
MEEQNQNNLADNNSAKYSFFYMLSLVALGFMAVSVGIIIFQIINKNIVDVIASYRACYSSSALKFAISAIIISAPVYYTLAVQLNKSLFLGKLDEESGVRKFLTYFILFVASVVIIGYLISVIYSFLDGELTIKFILKALTALSISAGVFTYYLFDIKRKNIVGNKNKIAKIYFIISLLVVMITLISGFIFIDSPMNTRMKKQDSEILNQFNSLKYAVENFYSSKKRLPQNLDELLNGSTNLSNKDIVNQVDGKKFNYKILSEDRYQLCSNFMASNMDDIEECYYPYGSLDEQWEHGEGYKCFEKQVFNDKDQNINEREILIEPVLER